MRTYHVWQQFTLDLIVSLHIEGELQMETTKSRVTVNPCFPRGDAYVGKLKNKVSSNGSTSCDKHVLNPLPPGRKQLNPEGVIFHTLPSTASTL